jgi:hypothetical protein
LKQSEAGYDGSFARSPTLVLIAAGLVLPLICGLIFFWPERTIANVDDLFFVPWAMEFAESGRHWNSLLAVQFPGLESYHLQPRLHLIFAGWFFALAGANTTTLVLFEFLCYALTNLVFVSICLTLKLRLAALFTPLIFAPMYVVAGFRLELSGALIFMFGLALSLPVLIKAVTGEKNQSRTETGCSILGMTLLGIAPLAAPATFAWSLGAIVVLEIWRLVARQAGPVRILFEGTAALALALIVFAVSIDFEFTEFLDQFTYHASRSTGGGFNDEAIFRAVIFAATAAVLFRKDRFSAALCAMLACGQFLAAFLHDKALIRNLAASMVFLIALDAVLAARWNKAKVALYSVLFLVLSANFFSFYLFSKNRDIDDFVVSAYSQDIKGGKRVFIDETMAHHYLDQQTNGALSWTWGGTFPKGRATSLNDLEDGDVWYLSEYTLLGYLKGRHDVARKIWEDQSYVRVPQIPCVLGRHSCNLPVNRWTMMRLERIGEAISVQAIGADTEPRLLPAPMAN